MTPMQRPKRIAKAALMLCLLIISTAADAQNDHTHQKKERKKEQSKEHKKDKVKAPTSDLPPIIWRDPAKISISNLIYGSGGIEHAPDPKSVYTFVNEDRAGSNPKFIVKDSKGVEWHVKIGSEPQSETAASRLLWAAGYFVDEDYYLPELTVRGLPKLHRGQKFVTRGEIVHGVRLKRKDHRIKKVGNWDWFQNPFVGTKEFNGLRVMMALLNNWDLKEINNAIYLVDGEQRYAVSDLGASFGKTGNIINRSRNDLEGYKGSKFIKTVRAE
jgi:hypothetical protein